MNKQTITSTVSIIHRRRVCAVGATVVLALVLSLTQGCASQATFDSADKAVDSLVAAARAQDIGQLKKVLGAESDEIISSNDDVADKNRLEGFLNAYDEKHQLVASKDGSMTLVVGKADWPLPIPIIQSGSVWFFDTKAGKEEILNRRIGRNELSAIQTCLAILDAQREYASLDRNADGLRDYAAQFISDPGQKNGLFWPTAENEAPSPLGPLAAGAAAEGYRRGDRADASPSPYHGYCFRILTAQGPNSPGGAMDYLVGAKLIGGFAIVAWPADYDNSGIMTFIMNHAGIVYQRDLGDETAKIAATMSVYDPGPQWSEMESSK
ncbi:MAG: DUF2950 domain-containing protein [Planctomycetota bacterium]|nr:DUF2950 domain-containing protein [Planctomycetota bacterium]